MSITQGNTPINVSTQTIQKCSVTCNFTYDYGISNLLANTYTNYVKLSFNSPMSKVEFQDEYYQVNEVRLYSPSLNTYYGKHFDAELIIHHVNSDNNLLVCIPIQSNNNSSSSSKLFDSIVPNLGQVGQPTSINVSNYTLNSFIPKSSYYLYNKANLPYSSFNGNYKMIVFDTKPVTYSNKSGKITVENTPINMSISNLNTLKKLIQPVSSLQVKEPIAVNLYYNVEGTYANDVTSDDIYIDCRPTGDEGMGAPIESSTGNSVLGSSIYSGLNTIHTSSNLLNTQQTIKKDESMQKGEIIAGSTIGVLLLGISIFGVYKLLTK